MTAGEILSMAIIVGKRLDNQIGFVLAKLSFSKSTSKHPLTLRKYGGQKSGLSPDLKTGELAGRYFPLRKETYPASTKPKQDVFFGWPGMKRFKVKRIRLTFSTED
jgi:hypothetical protein